MKNPKPNPEKGKGSKPLLKVLGKVAEYVIPRNGNQKPEKEVNNAGNTQ